MKVTLKSTIGVLKMDGREYGPGDTVEMSESEASKIAHYLEEDLQMHEEEVPNRRRSSRSKSKAHDEEEPLLHV